MANDVQELLKSINDINQITNEKWLNNLADRKLKELEFHNLNRDPERLDQEESSDTYEKFYGNKKYYTTTERSFTYVDNWIKQSVKDKVFLDFACGNGARAIQAAECGAKLSIGLDISDISVKNAENTAQEKGIDNIVFLQSDCEDTKLPDSSVDIVICSGMLHHLDLSHVFPELRRILSPGGKILAVEALDYNPFIKLYRLLTPDMRTEWEKAHILDLSDVKFARRFFDVKEVKHWHITSYAGAHFPRMLPILNFIDKILEKIPLLKLMSWIFTFEMHSDKKI